MLDMDTDNYGIVMTRQYEQQLEAAHDAFARLITQWRARNRWSLRTAYDWQRECPELIPVSLSHSVFTKIERGLAIATPPSTFLALGALNQALASDDRGNIKTRALRQLVYEASPICDDDGRPWDATDFFAANVGAKPIPPEFLAPQKLDDEIAAKLSSGWRRQFQQVLSELPSGDPLELLQQLDAARGDDVPADAMPQLRACLIGSRDYLAAELEAGRLPSGELLPEALLARLEAGPASGEDS